MAYEPRDNSGSLFLNDKQGNQKRPDRRGSAMINGKEYWVSAWDKRGPKGDFISLAFEEKDVVRPVAPSSDDVPRPAAKPATLDDGDTIPF